MDYVPRFNTKWDLLLLWSLICDRRKMLSTARSLRFTQRHFQLSINNKLSSTGEMIFALLLIINNYTPTRLKVYFKIFMNLREKKKSWKVNFTTSTSSNKNFLFSYIETCSQSAPFVTKASHMKQKRPFQRSPQRAN